MSTNIDIPEEDYSTYTLVKFAGNVVTEDLNIDTPMKFPDTGFNICLAEVQNFEQLMLEVEAAERSSLEDENHYQEIKIDMVGKPDNDYDHTPE
jgi:hypothetical protein